MSEWSDPAFEKVADIVRSQTGLSFASNRRSDAESSIRRAMSRARASDVSQYLALIEAKSIPLDDLVVELTVGETYFFRDPQHFDFMRREVFPDVLGRRGPAHALRVWSAGCASGEEPYSLAITLDDAGLDGHVLATDISRASLRKAREARYRSWALRGVDEDLVRRCFRQTGSDWTLDPRFRTRVTFRFHNLAEGSYPSVPAGIWGMDLVLCRNVLIYLDKESINRVARRLTESLTDGGWLITGPSDPPLDGVASLTPTITDSGVFYRKMCAPAAHTDAVEWRTEVNSHAGGGAPRPEAAALRSAPQVDGPAAASLRVRAIANAHGSEQASIEVTRLLDEYPLSTELHLLRSVLLIDLKRDDEAARALRRVLYLDRSLVFANFLLASVLRRQGRLEDARRAYRNTRDLARVRPPDEELAFADGERAGTIAELAENEMEQLDAQLAGA